MLNVIIEYMAMGGSVSRSPMSLARRQVRQQVEHHGSYTLVSAVEDSKLWAVNVLPMVEEELKEYKKDAECSSKARGGGFFFGIYLSSDSCVP